MEWLISEVFGPAKDIGDTLAAAPNDDRLPVSLASLVLLGDAPPPTRGHVFFTRCLEPLSRMKDGLEVRDQEVGNLPADVAAEIRNLQRIVNCAVGIGMFGPHDEARYYAGSGIGECGSRGLRAVIRHVRGVPFPSAVQSDRRRRRQTMTGRLSRLD